MNFILFLHCLLHIVLAKDSKCRALALQSGANKGAFAIGALKAFTFVLPPIDYSYDVVVGVSVGAINAAGLAVYPIGEEKAAIDSLFKMYLKHPLKSLTSHWPIVGPLQGLWRTGIMDNSGVKQLLEEVLEDRPFYRKLSVYSSDLNSGNIVVFDESMPKDHRSELILSSSSIPFYFPAVVHEQQMLVDGGLFSDLNMDEAILRCREMGFNDTDIIVDVIYNFDGRVELNNFTKEEHKYQNPKSMFKRKEELHGFWRAYRDVIK